jgi:hypothetical protein
MAARWRPTEWPERAFDIRERFQRQEKDRIGALAASLVVDGESIALDASTTALAMARHLRTRRAWANLTVITNGLRIAAELAGFPGITVVMPGGFVRWEALSVVGPLGDGLFRKVNVQKAFMGAAGFSLASGLSDATSEARRSSALMVAGAHESCDRRSHEVAASGLRDLLPHRGPHGRPRRRTHPAAMVKALRDRGIDVRLAGRGTVAGSSELAGDRAPTEGRWP